MASIPSSVTSVLKNDNHFCYEHYVFASGIQLLGKIRPAAEENGHGCARDISHVPTVDRADLVNAGRIRNDGQGEAERESKLNGTFSKCVTAINDRLIH